MHCISDLEQYKRIDVCTTDTDVLILLVSSFSQYYKLCGDIEIYGDMLNSYLQYIISAALALDKEICNSSPFF